MRVCPNCGFQDPVCWHSYRWITDIDYTPYAEFIKFYPQFKHIECGEILEDSSCYYRRSCKRNNGLMVFRWPKVYGPKYYNMRDVEHYKKPLIGEKQLELKTFQLPESEKNEKDN